MKASYIFVFLCLLFLGFSFSIYMKPFTENAPAEQESRSLAGKGRLVWQKYNCQSCHQLFGLGGYLGPDLSNLTSTKGKCSDYIMAIVRSGTAQMPAFNVSAEEEEQLLEFLRAADACGSADPRTFDVSASGMISTRK